MCEPVDLFEIERAVLVHTIYQVNFGTLEVLRIRLGRRGINHPLVGSILVQDYHVDSYTGATSLPQIDIDRQLFQSRLTG